MCVYVHGPLLPEKNSSRDGSEGRIAVSILSKGSVLTGTEDGFVTNNIKWGSRSSSIIKYHHSRLVQSAFREPELPGKTIYKYRIDKMIAKSPTLQFVLYGLQTP